MARVNDRRHVTPRSETAVVLVSGVLAGVGGVDEPAHERRLALDGDDPVSVLCQRVGPAYVGAGSHLDALAALGVEGREELALLERHVDESFAAHEPSPV
jgi:hypothetical protein